EALAEHGADLPVLAVESWKVQPAFIEVITERIRDGLERFPAEERDNVPVVFTAHSLPERILKWGDPYPEELRISVEAVVEHAGLRNWRFSYQSAGATADPWLGPDLDEVLEELAG